MMKLETNVNHLFLCNTNCLFNKVEDILASAHLSYACTVSRYTISRSEARLPSEPAAKFCCIVLGIIIFPY
jgi:hypothetical protein